MADGIIDCGIAGDGIMYPGLAADGWIGTGFADGVIHPGVAGPDPLLPAPDFG